MTTSSRERAEKAEADALLAQQAQRMAMAERDALKAENERLNAVCSDMETALKEISQQGNKIAERCLARTVARVLKSIIQDQEPRP